MDSIREIGVKTLYLPDGREASDWVSCFAPSSSVIDTPKFSSGLSVREVDGNNRGTAPIGLGVMCNMGNNLVDSQTGVCFLSGKPTHKGRCNFDLTEGEGWRRAIALLTARDLSKDHWVIHKDEYLVPSPYREVR